MICSGHTKTPVRKDRRFVWKAKDFSLLKFIFAGWGGYFGWCYSAFFCFVSLRERFDHA